MHRQMILIIHFLPHVSSFFLIYYAVVCGPLIQGNVAVALFQVPGSAQKRPPSQSAFANSHQTINSFY